jgi:hypothetical protein
MLGVVLFAVAWYGAHAQAIGEPARLNSVKLLDGSQFEPATAMAATRSRSATPVATCRSS